MVQGLWITYQFYRKVVSSNVNNYNQILNTKNRESIILPYKKAHKKVHSKGSGRGGTSPLRTRSKGQCIRMYIPGQECLSHTILWVDTEKKFAKTQQLILIIANGIRKWNNWFKH